MGITSNEERTANRLADLERRFDQFISQDTPGSQLFTAGYIPFGGANGALNSDANLQWDNTNKRLGIGLASPLTSLHVNFSSAFVATITEGAFTGGTYVSIKNNSTGGRDYWIGSTGSASGAGVGVFAIYDSTASLFRLLIDGNGNIGINALPYSNHRVRIVGVDNTSSNGALIVENAAGTTLMQNRNDNVNRVGTAWVVISDEDVKKDIKPLTHGIDKLRQLLPKEYKTKLGNYPMFGLVAQDVAMVLPELVVEFDGLLGVRYNDLFPILINAVVDLQNQLDVLKQPKPLK